MAEHRRGEAPRPYRPARKPGPRKPDLPEERPFIPRDAWRDLRATVPPAAVDDVVKAVGAAAQALEDGDTDRAIVLLQWAKSAASRTATIREALGVAFYAAERFSEAQSELLAYRRLSGSADQNHLLADCARALGKPEKVAPYVEEMIAAGVDPERVAEGVIVIAGERADRGDLEGALDAIHRVELNPVEIQAWHPRVWYVAGDLCERLGRTEQARDFFSAILAVDEEFGDAEERLAALD
jgi:tetratricopeptide (TPR) repeat protein